MRELTKIAEALFEKIRSRFEDVSLGDENANSTQNPKDARFFNFDFMIDGQSHGNVTISLADGVSLKIYYSKNITQDLQDEQKTDWENFLRELRMFAKRNILSFEPRDITRSIKQRDIKQVSKADSTFTKDEVVTEAKLHGTSRSSYQECGPVRIIVRHSDRVDPEQHGARARHIKAIYLENQDGERFKLPENNLRLARAQAQHLSHGGQLNDDLGQHITKIAEEIKKLRPFKHAMRHRTFEDVETQNMVEAAFEYHGLLNNTLKRLGGKKGYERCKETFVADDTLMDDIDVTSLRERFVKRTYNDKMDEALPLVQKAYKMKQENKLASQFESWANLVAEGTWAIPETEEQVDSLIELLSEPLAVGVDAANATNALYDLVGSDDLFDKLADLAKQDPEADARITITTWLEDNLPMVYQKVLSAIGDDPNYPAEVTEGNTYGDAMPGGTENMMAVTAEDEEYCDACDRTAKDCVCEDYDEDQVDMIASAIIRRILNNVKDHTALIMKAGPDGIMNAARDVASFHAPVDELGSSDISIMVREVYNEVGVPYPEHNLQEGKMKEIALDIEELSNKAFKAKYGKTKEEMQALLAEGLTGLQKFGAGAALVGALAGQGYLNKQSTEHSPQLQKLEQLYQQALAKGDEAKADELEDRIDNLKTRLELGKGEVMGKDGNPVDPTYESVENPAQASFTKLQELAQDNTEGIVLLGAGGPLNDWINGVFGIWKDEGMTKATSPSDVFADAMVLKTTGGRTDLALVFKDGADLDMGKLAMWRLRFGDCSWISDYVVNYAEQHGLTSGEEDLAEMKRLAGLK